jgi:hypothetical protein
MGVDVELNARASSNSCSPWASIADEVRTEGNNGMRGRIEEFAKRKKGAGGENREEQHDRNCGGEPAGTEKSEDEKKELVACYGEPVERSIETV